jgi:hypothetical protein
MDRPNIEDWIGTLWLLEPLGKANVPAERFLELLRYTLDLEKRKNLCEGCGNRPMSAVRAILEGRVACCPDCSTFTLKERNEIRTLALKNKI